MQMIQANQIDLHMHTTASDGNYTPREVVTLAHELGLAVIAITDHDTTQGIEEAQSVGKPLGVRVIPGIELSAESEEDGDVHILGYFVDVSHEAFQIRLRDFQESRYHRGRGIVRKLHGLGMNVSWEKVQAIAVDAPIARPHIARALVEEGFVDNLQEAFDKYLANDGPAYVVRMKMLPEEAVDLIHLAGGVAIMAHPGKVDRYETLLPRLVANGIDGVEVIHPHNSEEVRATVHKIVQAHQLIATGGSDFHRYAEDRTNPLGQYNPPSAEVIHQLETTSKKYIKV